MNSFDKIIKPDELKRALQDLQFEKPTEVQSAVIPVMMQGQDLMACAETGSGKTAAYGIPMVQKLLRDTSKEALVLAPTRELAHQIAEFLRKLTFHCEEFRVTALVGGADIKKQVKALRKNPRIIVATPGRLIDHLRRKSVKLESTNQLVLDEGDRMLDMGFAPQLDDILKHLPKSRQSSLFTATLPKKVRSLAAKYLNKPEQIDVGKSSMPVASIKQTVIQVTPSKKNDIILDELNSREGSIIVFVRTKERTSALAKYLKSYGYSIDVIHGGRSQGQRNRAMQSFKNGNSKILCATDLAARGIDIPQVAHIINFDLPMMDEDYVHRIGRTARNGASGEAVSFVTPRDHRTWKILTNKYKIQNVELQATESDEPKERKRRVFKKPSTSTTKRGRPQSRRRKVRF